MLVTLLGSGACRSAEQADTSTVAWVPDPAADLGPVVARVGGSPIFSAEVQAEMAREPAGRTPREALDTLVKLHLLAERARRAGRPLPIADVPATLLVQRLMEREFEPATTPARMPEDDLMRAYQQTKINYVHPRMVEVALLSVYTGPTMKPEPRARARETAMALAEELRRKPRRTAAEVLALAESPGWKERKVAYWKFWQGPDRAHGPFGGKVAPAIHRLRKQGDTSGLIEDESGYHFALFLAEKAPRNVPFAEAKAEIRQKAYPAWRRHRFEVLASELAAQHTVEVFRDRVLAAPGD